MRHTVICCGLWLLSASPGSAADLLNGDWFILTARGGIVASDPEHPIARKLEEPGRKGNIEHLTIAPDGGWYVQLDSGFVGRGFPQAAFKKAGDLGDDH